MQDGALEARKLGQDRPTYSLFLLSSKEATEFELAWWIAIPSNIRNYRNKLAGEVPSLLEPSLKVADEA